jgi:osmotically-inducible protein OsmY
MTASVGLRGGTGTAALALIEQATCRAARSAGGAGLRGAYGFARKEDNGDASATFYEALLRYACRAFVLSQPSGRLQAAFQQSRAKETNSMNSELSDDQALQRAVLAALASEAMAPGRIGVTVQAGVVTLFGYVRSAAQKRAAEAAALQVKGVKAVAVAIQIRSIKAARSHDDELAAEVTTRLAWDAAVPPDALKVTVERGRVTLFGELKSDAQRVAALEDVSRLFGVAALRDRTSLKA